MKCPDQEFQVGVDLKLPFWGKNREIGINRKICRKYEKGNLTIFIIEIHVLAKFHEEVMIFDEIRGQVKVLNTPNFKKTRLI